MNNRDLPPEKLTLRPSITPGKPFRQSIEDFPKAQAPFQPMNQFLYIQALNRTKSTIFGKTEYDTVASEYFHVPKGAKRTSNIEHKTAVTNTFCMGDSEHVENLTLLYSLQVISREESFILWDQDDHLEKALKPVLEKRNYRCLNIFLPAEMQDQMCEILSGKTQNISRLEELIDITDINQMLQTMRGDEDKTAIILSVEKHEASEDIQRLYYLLVMHIYIYVSNVGRTEQGRYFFWPVHFLIPEIAILKFEDFPFLQLERARYRGFLSFLGSSLLVPNLEFLQYRPVIKTAFVNNLLVLESKNAKEIEDLVRRDLDIGLSVPDVDHVSGDRVWVLTERQIKNKMDPFIFEEMCVQEHPFLREK